MELREEVLQEAVTFFGRVFGTLSAIESAANLVGLAAAVDAVGVIGVMSAGALLWLADSLVALVRASDA